MVCIRHCFTSSDVVMFTNYRKDVVGKRAFYCTIIQIVFFGSGNFIMFIYVSVELLVYELCF